MSAGVEIRDARPAEREALEALQRRASDVHVAYREALAAHPDAIALDAAAIAAGRVRVAELGGRAIGFSEVLAPDGGAVELEGLFVEPEAQRTGVGRGLVADAGRRARAAGASRLEVTGGPESSPFYVRIGFVAGAATPTRFGPAQRLSLDLS